MTESRKICVVTGSRADFGLLLSPLRAIMTEPTLALQLVATGMHPAPEFGRTIDAIRAEGFEISEVVETLVSSDSGVGVAKSVGLGVIGFADTFARIAPDLVLLLGDRFEILAAAQAAMFLRIPIAHLYGGDVTEGAIDESIRHAISKMAHVHFPSNPQSAARLLRLGEMPDRVHLVGAPGIDAILAVPRLSRSEVEAAMGFRLRDRNLLVTFHPVTAEPGRTLAELEELLAALATLDDTGLVFTRANADSDGRAVNARIEAFVADRDNAVLVASLGTTRYISTMALVDAVVGNSSSGLYEAPSLGVPTVDVGDRQKGRMRARSVRHVEPDRVAIRAAIDVALECGRMPADNPYGDGTAGRRIAAVLAAIEDPRKLLQKGFYDGPEGAYASG